MELKHIKELMGAMARSGTKRLSIKREGFELELEREVNASIRPQENFLDSGEEFVRNPLAENYSSAHPMRAFEQDKPTGQQSFQSSTQVQKSQESPGIFVTAPMVGTFYISPSPDDANFVKVGDKVEKNTVVCIIEAMKVMNEVKAGVSGTVSEVLLESGHPVEFGAKLFRIV